MAFPPAKGSNRKTIPVVESTTVTTGKGGIKASLKLKAAGTKNTPGVDKTVNLF